ncbi:MAG: thiamine pyrophosphate-binding protein [Pseudomonadota bacterium]
MNSPAPTRSPTHTPTRPLGAQISHMLKARGVDVIFGIPGVHNQEMYRGIEEAGIQHVLARHEQGAGFMADGYARATGKPGVAYIITGPGLCNIMTPLGQAYSDSVSVLAISSCLDESSFTRGQLHQMLDQRAAADCACDWSYEASSAKAAYGLIDRALTEFSTKRARSKHIQVPISLLEGDAEGAPPAQPGARAEGTQTLSGATTASVSDMVRGSNAPLLIFGGALAQHGTAGEDVARALVKSTGAAAFTSYAGAGLLPRDEPLNHGCYLGRPDSVAVLAKADLVVVIGCELSECDLWRTELGHDCPMIRVDIDPEVLSDLHRAEVIVQADAMAFAQALLAKLPPQTEPKWDTGEIDRAKARFKAETDAERPGIVPVCDALAAALPADTMIYSDMTQFAYVAKEVWDMPRAGHWHHPTGFGTLGYALPASIGGAVARRGKPTLCIAGDYGFQYTVQELGAAVELGLALPILVWDNGKLKEIEDSMVRAQIAPNAVIAQNPDFAALGRAYGALAATPQSIDEVIHAVLTAFDADRPTVIHVDAGVAS